MSLSIFSGIHLRCVALAVTLFSSLPIVGNCQFVGKLQLTMPGTGKQVNFERFEFESYVDDLIIDSAGRNFLISLKSNDPASGGGRRSSFMRFDSEKPAILWKTKKYPATLSHLAHHVLISEEAPSNKSIMLDINTGEVLWKKSFEWIGYKPSDSMIYGNRRDADFRKGPLEIFKTLEGYDRNTGELVWSQNVPFSGIDQTSFWRNDTTLILENNGVHIINTIKKTVWSYISPSQEWNLKLLSDDEISSRYAVPFQREVKMRSGIGSNFVMRGDSLYFAGSQMLTCVNTKGSLFWEAELTKDQMTKSDLLTHNQYLILLNKGLLYENGYPTLSGIPFVRIFNRYTGEELFKKLFEEGQFIRTFTLGENDISIVVENRIYKIDLKTGFETSFAELPKVLHNKVSYFLVKGFYISEDEKKAKHYVPSQGIQVIKTTSDTVLTLDSSYKVLEKFDSKRILKPMYNHPKFKVYANSEMSIITNPDGIILLTTTPYWNIAARKDYVFMVREKHIDKIKISDLE